MSNRTAVQYTLRQSVEFEEVSVGRRAAVLLALFVTGFATFVSVYVTQPLLPQFREIFHASELMVSLTVSAPVIAVALAAPLLGALADSMGRKRVIIAALLGLSIPSVLAATAESLPQLIAWRFLQGLFIPGIITVAMAYISEETPHRMVGSTMATYVTGTVVGGFSGRFIAGICAHHYNWQMAFVFLGIVSLVGCLLTFCFLPRSTKFVRQSSTAASLDSLRSHLHNPQLLATYAIGFNVLFCQVASFTYVNFYLADKPFLLGPAALGAIFTVYLIGAVITPVAGMILDRVGYRRTLMAAVGTIAAGTLLTLIHSLPLIIAGLALSATGVFICQAAASSYVGKAAGKARSSAAGLYVALYYFGGFLGSVIPGFFWGLTGWPGCVALIICMQAAILCIAWKMWRN
ncbi:MAG: MFS transporter [Desulfocapsaceae bacterium]|nr:MFS transporter [Desulfocapsaceae bacterium]